MADQDRWYEERNRGGRYGADERAERGYREYGQRSEYGSDDGERGGRRGEGRSFNTGNSYGPDDQDDRFGRDGGQGYGQRYGQASGGPRGDYGYGGRSGSDSYRGPNYGQTSGGGAYTPPQPGGRDAYGQGYKPFGGQGYQGDAGYGAEGYGVSAQGGSSGFGGSSGGQSSARRYGGSTDYASQQGYDDGGDRSWLERAGHRLGEKVGALLEGRHRGRGPKNYSRSDDRIREDINDRLTDDTWLDASEIEVTVTSAEVTLSGTVQTREEKRRAEDVAEQVSGVKHVQNNLRIEYGGSTGSTAAGASPNASTSTGTSATSATGTGSTGTSATNGGAGKPTAS